MLNLPELEKRWLRYKIKSYIPYGVTTLLLGSALTAGYFFYPTFMQKETHTPVTTSNKLTNKEHNNTKTPTIIAQKHPIKKVQTTQPKQALRGQNKHADILTPSMDFLSKIDHPREQNSYNAPTYQPPAFIAPQEPDHYYKPKPKPRVKPKPKPARVTITKHKEQTQTYTPKKSSILIKRKETQHDIDNIIARFKKSQNPALSLFVAKKYYEMGLYKKAYNYALITNKIDPKIEDSWIIFAKSLVKLGKKDLAIKTLYKYIQYSDSQQASRLLKKIQTRRFQ